VPAAARAHRVRKLLLRRCHGDCVTLCPLYSGCGRTLGLLCAAAGCRPTTTRPCMQWNYPAMPKMLHLLDKMLIIASKYQLL